MYSPKLAKIHKWLGLYLAVYFGLQAVAGTVLIFSEDIQRWLAPAAEAGEAVTGVASTMEQVQQDAPAALDRVTTILQNTYPTMYAERINFPAAEGLPFIARLVDADGGRHLREVSLVTATAAPLSTTWHILEWITDFHINFLTGTPGHYLVGVSGIVLIVMAISGLIVAWPGLKRLRAALRVTFKVPVKTWFELHRSVGLITAIIVLLTAFTGSVIVFSPQLKPLFIESTPLPQAAVGDVMAPGTLLAIAQREFPDTKLRNVRLKPGYTVYRVIFSGAEGGAMAPSHQVWLDPVSGAVQKQLDGGNLPAAEGFFAWMYPLHVELALGRTGQWVIAIGGLGLLALSVSGMWLWYRRREIRVRAARKTAAAASANRAERSAA